MDLVNNNFDKNTKEGESHEENLSEKKESALPGVVLETKRIKITHATSRGAYERLFKESKAENRTGDFPRWIFA